MGQKSRHSSQRCRRSEDKNQEVLEIRFKPDITGDGRDIPTQACYRPSSEQSLISKELADKVFSRDISRRLEEELEDFTHTLTWIWDGDQSMKFVYRTDFRVSKTNLHVLFDTMIDANIDVLFGADRPFNGHPNPFERGPKDMLSGNKPLWKSLWRISKNLMSPILEPKDAKKNTIHNYDAKSKDTPSLRPTINLDLDKSIFDKVELMNNEADNADLNITEPSKLEHLREVGVQKHDSITKSERDSSPQTIDYSANVLDPEENDIRNGCLREADAVCIALHKENDSTRHSTAPSSLDFGPDSHGRPSSYILERFLSSMSELGVAKDTEDSMLTRPGVDSEHPKLENTVSPEGHDQRGHNDSDQRASFGRATPLDNLDLSTVLCAEDYWIWDDHVKNYYHRDEDTQSIVWYGPLD